VGLVEVVQPAPGGGLPRKLTTSSSAGGNRSRCAIQQKTHPGVHGGNQL